MSANQARQPEPRMIICRVLGEDIFDVMETTRATAQEDLECLQILRPELKLEIYEEI